MSLSGRPQSVGDQAEQAGGGRGEAADRAARRRGKSAAIWVLSNRLLQVAVGLVELLRRCGSSSALTVPSSSLTDCSSSLLVSSSSLVDCSSSLSETSSSLEDLAPRCPVSCSSITDCSRSRVSRSSRSSRSTAGSLPRPAAPVAPPRSRIAGGPTVVEQDQEQGLAVRDRRSGSTMMSTSWTSRPTSTARRARARPAGGSPSPAAGRPAGRGEAPLRPSDSRLPARLPRRRFEIVAGAGGVVDDVAVAVRPRHGAARSVRAHAPRPPGAAPGCPSARRTRSRAAAQARAGHEQRPGAPSAGA